MKFLTDENIFVPIVKGLRSLGHDVLDIKEQQLSGTEDPDVFKMAVEQARSHYNGQRFFQYHRISTRQSFWNYHFEII